MKNLQLKFLFLLQQSLKPPSNLQKRFLNFHIAKRFNYFDLHLFFFLSFETIFSGYEKHSLKNDKRKTDTDFL